MDFMEKVQNTLSQGLETSRELFGKAREKAEAEAINVFGDNLKDLLLAAPAGPKTVLGLDPGIRTACKIAAVDATSALAASAVPSNRRLKDFRIMVDSTGESSTHERVHEIELSQRE